MLLQASLEGTADTVIVEGKGQVGSAAIARVLELLACVPDLGPLPALKPAPEPPLVVVVGMVEYEGPYSPLVIVATRDEGPGKVLDVLLSVARSSPRGVPL